MTVSSFQVAKKICELSNWTVTNLKLQKILYLAQMVHLGRNNGDPLIDEKFEAWMYGPVLPNLYKIMKEFGGSPVRNRFYNVPPINNQNVELFLEEIWHWLKDKHGWELVGMTHSPTGAWAKHYKSDINASIPTKDILNEYREINV